MNVVPNSRLSLKALLFVVLVGSGALHPTSGQTPPADDKVVKLPDLTVTDSAVLPEPEAWRYTRFGNIDVLSNASDVATKRLLADLGKFQRGMQLVWPTPPPTVAAASLILCDKTRDFSQFRPRDIPPDEVPPVSRFVRNREQSAILVDLATDNIAIQDGTTAATQNATSVEYDVDHYRQLYREYAHFLMSRSEARLPAWLEEGIAQIVMDIDLSGRTLTYGKVDSTRGAAVGLALASDDSTDSSTDATSRVGEQPFNIVLLHQKLMPLGPFFAVTHDSPEAQNPLGNNLWAKQAYAFVHFCLFGENLRYKDALAAFVQQTAHEPATEEVFKRCFKIGYADMEKQLRGYILNTRHKYQRYTLQPADLVDPKSIELSDATPGMIGLVKGDAYSLAGKLPEAVAEYRTAYLRGAREPALLAAFGEAEMAAGNKDRGRELLEAASRANVARPSAYVALARLRFASQQAVPRGADGRLAGEQVALVLAPLFNARKYEPALPETYGLIADAWAASSVAPSAGNLAVLDEGIRRFPRDSSLLLKSAQLYLRIGQKEQAAAIARLGVRFPADAAAKAEFERLVASLPPPAPGK